MTTKDNDKIDEISHTSVKIQISHAKLQQSIL